MYSKLSMLFFNQISNKLFHLLTTFLLATWLNYLSSQAKFLNFVDMKFLQQFVRKLPLPAVVIKTYGVYGPQAVKLIKQIGKKYRKLKVKKCLLFISCRVFQWQYETASLIFMFKKQKCFDKTYVTSIIF